MAVNNLEALTDDREYIGKRYGYASVLFILDIPRNLITLRYVRAYFAQAFSQRMRERLNSITGKGSAKRYGERRDKI